ncbi:L-threonylcarbamoyladenylate synthase [Silvibacterium dinghuense]|uniref:Threonylcarbamoyl-AMP synthase n=1 Tax=Silvibacterium dinghuense TaxID=1560006 RepID=A0A4Q1SH50_9BACT|nr:L-threonylcarbamoyladenylate synthase [Silvibacterium dinghuense]RXS96490.1 threonylcarbamoyl-AMP synthase [Silvibacterium dinghuense]GGG91203.1 threonylcarbamoyl-AMP synthase [Silvibacterium dinghuense]
MHTERLIVEAAAPDSPDSRSAITAAAAILRGGGTVAFPTETVYGLGANARSAQAVAKIFAAKQRPSWDPLIVHIADRDRLPSVVASVPDSAKRLIDAYWPGPLTLLLPRQAAIPDAVTAGRPLVGVRIPQHPVAQALIRAAQVPVAAPSANRFGHTSPTTAAHVLEDLDGRIDAILELRFPEGAAAETTHGVESTVVDPTGQPVLIYRPGAITLEQVRALCPNAIAYAETARTVAATPESMPSPGVGIRHYAPRARLLLVEPAFAQQALFEEAARQHAAGSQKLGLMLPEGWGAPESAIRYAWGCWSDTEELARRLFAGLRWLDAEGAELILCPLPEQQGIGAAIADRLRKAARTE